MLKKILGHIIDNTHVYVIPILLGIFSLAAHIFGEWLYISPDARADINALGGLAGQFALVTLVAGFFLSQWTWYPKSQAEYDALSWPKQAILQLTVILVLASLLWFLKPNH